jgi:hypothetical protein
MPQPHPDPNMKTMELFTCSTLHLMLGAFMKIYDELDSRIDGLDLWPKHLGVHKEDYHGGAFEVSVLKSSISKNLS